MSYPFQEIIIIYNPNSTGDGAENAKSLKSKLSAGLDSTTITLLETKYAGHAVKIGRNYAKENQPILLVSSSGDGGYNELLNGVMSVKNHDKVAVCVLPSGNANDHYNSVNGEGVAKKIISGQITRVDIISVSGKTDGKPWQRYAHSYVGFGMTAYIGKKLTQADLNPINEKWLVLKYLLLFRHVTLRELPEGRWRRYSNFVVGNIDRMSKVIKLSTDATTDDGILEVYKTRSTSPLSHLVSLIVGSALGIKPATTISSLELVSKRVIEAQSDGEVFTCDAREPVRIAVVPNALNTVT